MKCIQCGDDIKPIDVSLTKKLINRGAEEFICKACLCKKYKLTEEQMDEMIEKFRRQGCGLF